MIEDGISRDLLSRLLSTQLLAHGEKHLLDHNRLYFRLLRRIFSEGRRSGRLTSSLQDDALVKAYALWERALLYDWCLCGGSYSLKNYAKTTMPMFLGQIRNKSF